MADDSASSDHWINWITIWQSEAAALLADREMQEAMQRTIDLWAAQAIAAVRVVGQAIDAQARRPGTAAPPRAASAAHAPDAPRDDRDDERGDERDRVVQRLHARIAELERRLASPA